MAFAKTVRSTSMTSLPDSGTEQWSLPSNISQKESLEQSSQAASSGGLLEQN